MADERYLVVRLGSLGDIVHTLPAVAALRDSFPGATVDWVVERKWSELLCSNPELSRVIALDRSPWAVLRCVVGQLRAARYTCAIDFQGLYKSAILAALSGAPARIGFDRQTAREGGATVFYTQRVSPAPGHKVEQNLALAKAAGARDSTRRFPVRIPAKAQAEIDRRLAALGLTEFFVVSPGGGWKSKCWPPARYGEVCREIERRHTLRAFVNQGPGEKALAEAVRLAAAPLAPVIFSSDILELMALLGRAKFIVAADTGPLHLASALGTPVIGLYGPTKPNRNGPYGPADMVVCNARAEDITYKRGTDYSPAMLSITVEQVICAIEQKVGAAQGKLANNERTQGRP